MTDGDRMAQAREASMATPSSRTAQAPANSSHHPTLARHPCVRDSSARNLPRASTAATGEAGKRDDDASQHATHSGEAHGELLLGQRVGQDEGRQRAGNEARGNGQQLAVARVSVPGQPQRLADQEEADQRDHYRARQLESRCPSTGT